jgi:hypothetical protein
MMALLLSLGIRVNVSHIHPPPPTLHFHLQPERKKCGKIGIKNPRIFERRSLILGGGGRGRSAGESDGVYSLTYWWRSWLSVLYFDKNMRKAFFVKRKIMLSYAGIALNA